MTVLVEALDNETVNARVDEPELPSATVALEIDTVGGVATTVVSSLVTDAVAVAVPRAAPEGLASDTVKVSSGSTTVSPATATFSFCDMTPGAKVSVPDAAV